MGLFGDDIEICASDGDIELCLERDIELCTECAELTLTGSDTPIIGDIYVAEGGKTPYVYSFDGGTIDSSTGEILSFDGCTTGDPRWATVSVVDADSSEAEITVRLPGGNWILYNTEDAASKPDNSLSCVTGDTGHPVCCTDDYDYTAGNWPWTNTVYAGGVKQIRYADWKYWYRAEYPGIPAGSAFTDALESCCLCATVANDYAYVFALYIWRIKYYEWRCI